MMMATPGNLVVVESGKGGVLPTGRPAIFNSSGECPACCGAEIPPCCQLGYTVQMPGTDDRPGLALSMTANMWADLWVGNGSGGWYHGLPSVLSFPELPLAGHQFSGSEETGGASFSKSCSFSQALSSSPEQAGIIHNPETGAQPVDGVVRSYFRFSQRAPGGGTSVPLLKVSAGVAIKRLFQTTPQVAFDASWSVQNLGDPVVFDWSLTRLQTTGGSAGAISIDREGMEFLGIPFHEDVVVDSASPGGLPTTCDLRIAYLSSLPGMLDPLHPLFDDPVPFDLTDTFKYFDVAITFDVTEAPVLCPGVG